MKEKNIEGTVESRVCFQERLGAPGGATRGGGDCWDETRGKVDPARDTATASRQTTDPVAGRSLRRPRSEIWSVLKAGYCRCLPNGRSKYET